MERAGHVYSRISNPTNAVLEQRVAALEGGIGAIATASGQAALHLAIATLMGAGGHIVASSAVRRQQNLLHYTLRASASRPPSSSPATSTAGAPPSAPTRAAVRRDRGQPGPGRAGHRRRGRHRPRGRPAAAGGLHLHHALAAQPFEHGADLVYHSATKFLGGHGTVIGGVLVDGGSFDWDASGRFPS
jgi:O-acetylhomoserine (thiol)-lyase